MYDTADEADHIDLIILDMVPRAAADAGGEDAVGEVAAADAASEDSGAADADPAA